MGNIKSLSFKIFTLRHHFTSTRMAKTKKKRDDNKSVNTEKLGLLYIVDHNKMVQSLWKTVLQFLEIKHIVSYDPKFHS